MYLVSDYQVALHWIRNASDTCLNSYHFLIRRAGWFFSAALYWVPGALMALGIFAAVSATAGLYHLNYKLISAVLLFLEGFCIMQAYTWECRVRRHERLHRAPQVTRYLTRRLVRERGWVRPFDDDPAPQPAVTELS